MRIIIEKALQPVVVPRVRNLKINEQFNIDSYTQVDEVFTVPSQDVNLENGIDIARTGAIVEAYEMWFEIPDVNINDNVPAGVSFEKYFDDQEPPVEQTRTWADLGLNAQGTSNSLRFWQPSNDGVFIWEDAEIIKDAGFKIYDKKGLTLRLNDDEYADTGDPEYVVLETIPYIDQNWADGYFDMIAARLRMIAIYEAKGGTDSARWAASDAEEREILVRWNIVGLNRANDIVDPAWTEGRKLKEIGRKYREFNLNMIQSTAIRFNDWYQYLNMVLSNSGKTKFELDWDWGLRDEYVSRFMRQFELGDVNKLVDFNNNTLGTYVDGDFLTTTITASQIVNNLEQVLAEEEYFI